MSIKINLTGDGLSLDREITILQAGQIITYLGSQQPSLYAGQDDSTVLAVLPGATDSPKRIVEKSEAKTFPDKITVLGKHIQDRDGRDNFSIPEVKNLLQKIGTLPANLVRDVKKATDDFGYIYLKDKKEGLYEVTEVGLEAIENKFPADAKLTSGKRKPSVAKKSSTGTIRDEVKKMEISTTLEGYPLFGEVGTKGNKILWLLIYADKLSIKSLFPSEVEYLSGEMKDRISSSGFTALNATNMKKSYVTKVGSEFRIQQKGIDYIKSLVKDESNK